MKKILFISTIFLIIFWGGILAGKRADYGGEVLAVEEKIQNLKLENDYLESQIALKTSCREIYKKAEEKGLVYGQIEVQKHPIAIKR